MSTEERQKIVDQARSLLIEHFDHVQILVTWNEPNGTHCKKAGAGNWYARQGMAREFIEEDVAQEHAVQIAQKINPPE